MCREVNQQEKKDNIRAIQSVYRDKGIRISFKLMGGGTTNDGKGLLFGGVSGVGTTDVVILGAGTVGEFAARSALGLGASVRIFDNSFRL